MYVQIAKQTLMLNFIERYQLRKNSEKPLPKKVREINELLKSDYLGNPYHISQGVKRGTYLAIDNYNFDEFDNLIIYTCPSLDSAISDIYSLIRKEYPVLTSVAFDAKNKLRDRFAKKYHKMLDEILETLFEIEPNFNYNCDLVTPELAKNNYNFDVDKDCFAYVIHDGSSIYDELSYHAPQHTESFLYKYLEQYFELESTYTWATKLTLKIPIKTPQQKWNERNKETVVKSNLKYNKKVPVIAFRPTKSLRSNLEELRLPNENDTDLLNRVLQKFLALEGVGEY